MFAIEVSATFSAAHALRLPAGGAEPLHGHDFRVTVRLAARALDSLHTVIDFHAVERMLATIVTPWSNRNLNEIEPFAAAVNPSAEGIIQEIAGRMERALAVDFAEDVRRRGLRLMEVRMTEAANCLAIWTPESD